MIYRILFVIFLLCYSLSLSSCGGIPDDKMGQERENVRSVVSLYTAILAEGYSHLNMGHLLQVATEKRATKAFHHMSSLAEANSKMLCTLEKTNFSEAILISEEKASVDTEEKWRYSYVSVDNGKEVFTNIASYKLTYHLLKLEDRWLVDDIAIREALEEKNPQDMLPFFQRPVTAPLPEKTKDL